MGESNHAKQFLKHINRQQAGDQVVPLGLFSQEFLRMNAFKVVLEAKKKKQQSNDDGQYSRLMMTGLMRSKGSRCC